MSWHGSRSAFDKHTMAIFLDISGAFDNLSWEKLFGDLELLGASDGTIAITKSYLINRDATLTLGGASSKVILSKGCPQGSIFGPLLWNASMETLLSSALPVYANIQAYADDIAVSIFARSRRLLKVRSGIIQDKILEWGNQRGLTFSHKKSTAMILNSSLVPGFRIPFGENHITVKPNAKYLGVWLDQELNYKKHIEELQCKNFDLFTRLRGTIGSSWGTSQTNAKRIYEACFIPKIFYGISFWANTATTSYGRKRLLQLQRRPLIGMSAAYNTASTMALQVITGTLPLDLEAESQAVIRESRRLPYVDQMRIRNEKREELITRWEARWSNSTKGRWTFEFIPSVKTKISTPIWINHRLVQMLTGHGNFRAKLYQFRLVETEVCSCNTAPETAKHVLFECPNWAIPRQKLEMCVARRGHLWPCSPSVFLSSKALYEALDEFVQIALSRQ